MRHNNSDEDIAKRSLAVFLYSMCKASYNFLGTKLFKVSPTTIMNWIKKYADSVEIPEVSGDIKENKQLKYETLSRSNDSTNKDRF
ncbi:MAG: hypothetical protein LBF44_00320 [Holosporaceae bacterium]|nr:hypothetical protein [Holosporaceae bacterium]